MYRYRFINSTSWVIDGVARHAGDVFESSQDLTRATRAVVLLERFGEPTPDDEQAGAEPSRSPELAEELADLREQVDRLSRELADERAELVRLRSESAEQAKTIAMLAEPHSAPFRELQARLRDLSGGAARGNGRASLRRSFADWFAHSQADDGSSPTSTIVDTSSEPGVAEIAG